MVSESRAAITTDPTDGSCASPDGTNYCDGGSTGTCHCDAGCEARGDCCADKIEVCGETTPTCAVDNPGAPPTLVRHGAIELTAPIRVVGGDFDGDGDNDLVAIDVINNEQRIRTYANDGTGSFTLVADRAEVYYPYELATGDLDGDGRLDLAFVGGSGPICRLVTLFGNGDGSFGARANLSAFEQTFELALVDLDRDGDLDVALSDNKHLTARLNDGHGQFGAQAPYLLGKTGAYRLDVSDFDGDGNIDLLASHERSPGGMTILRGNGNGTFDGAGQRFIQLEKQVGEIVTPDLDHDGHRDVVYAAWNYPKVIGVRRGVGGGNLDPNVFEYVPGGDRPRYLDAADMNCDGDADIIARSETGSTGGWITIFPGDGSGLLEDGAFTKAYGLRDVDLVDLDGDHVPDVAAVRRADGWFGDPAAHEVTIFLTRLAP